MRKSILVVDDDELGISLLCQIFENDYNIITARDGKEAIQKLNQSYEDIVIILLDLIMPVLNGYQVLRILKSSNAAYKDIPVAMVTSNTEPSLELACYGMGAVAVIHKPYSAKNVRRQIDNIIEMYASSVQLKQTLDQQLKKLNNFYDHLTDAMSTLVEFRDLESGMHIRRVKGMTKIMAQGYMELFPESGLTEMDVDIIMRASAIHDIGKIAIPDNILLKPGCLTESERQIMMSHTTKGCEILDLLVEMQEDEYMKISYEICRHHHERYDGRGYPDKLKGDEIPLSAQLVSIVDVYDALVSPRVYKQPYSKTLAFHMIINEECGVFSPNIIQCFRHVIDKIEAFSDDCQ